MTLCDGTYKNGNPCRNNHLPAYTRCGLHGGYSINSVIRDGNLTELQHICSITSPRQLNRRHFYNSCYLGHVDIVKFILRCHMPSESVIFNVRNNPNTEPKILECLPPIIDELSEILSTLTIKTEPCYICYFLSEDTEVLVLPCCKNVMCSKCIKSWNTESDTCPFCRKTIF